MKNSTHQHQRIFTTLQAAHHPTPSHQQSADSNQFYQMLTLIRELEIELNNVLRDNETLQQDNSQLQGQLTVIQETVGQQEIKISSMRGILMSQPDAQRAMLEYQTRLQQLASQINQLQEIVADKNKAYTVLSSQHQIAYKQHSKNQGENNRIMYLLNQLVGQLSQITADRRPHQDISISQSTLLLHEKIQLSMRRVSEHRSSIELLKKEGDDKIVQLRKRRHQLERKVEVLKQRSETVRRGQGNCVECKIEAVLDDLLVKEQRLTDQITEMQEVNDALQDRFSSTVIEFQQQLRFQHIDQKRHRQQLERELGVLRSRLQGLQCQEKEWTLRLTRIVEDRDSMSHHQTSRDSHILEQIRQLQCENRELEAELVREQAELRIIRSD